MKISVIIPAYNASETIGEQLAALAAQDYTGSWEVIVVDNGSDDNTVEIARQCKDKIRDLKIVSASEKKGASFARNSGVDHSVGSFLLFCDADDVAAPGWLREMASAAETHRLIACRWEMEKLNPFATSRPKKGGQADGLLDFFAPFLPFAGAGSLGVEKELFQKIGGFDEELKVVEDTDFCWRAQLAGAELVFVPDAVMHIRYCPETFGEFRQSALWAEANVYLYKRYLDKGMPKVPFKHSILAILRLLKRYRRFFTSDGRKALAWRAGRLTGTLKGSLKNRVFVLR